MKRKKKIILGLMALLVPVTALANLRLFNINGPSMAPSLLWGDKVLSNHLAYDLRIPFTDHVLTDFGNPKHGDIVLYWDIPKQTYAVKRIIGLPGDRVEVKENIVYLNDTALEQTSLEPSDFSDTPDKNALGQLIMEEDINGTSHLLTYTSGTGSARNHELTVVPDNQYFILGDHRDNSADSRFIGCISRDQIKGKVFYTLRNE